MSREKTISRVEVNIRVDVHTSDIYETVVKRTIDIILSFFGLVLLSLVFLFITLWILIDDPGPVLFTQKRLGKNKQYFKLHKFGSMKMSTPHDKPTHMLENPKQYITKSGKFIRVHSLDGIDIIGQSTKTLILKGVSLISPNHTAVNANWKTAHVPIAA